MGGQVRRLVDHGIRAKHDRANERYQRSTGFKPIGLHRPSADRVLRGVSQRCVRCGGDGYHAVGKSWLWCEACGGLGRLMTPKAQFTLRRQVVERYPASAIEGLTLVVG